MMQIHQSKHLIPTLQKLIGRRSSPRSILRWIETEAHGCKSTPQKLIIQDSKFLVQHHLIVLIICVRYFVLCLKQICKLILNHGTIIFSCQNNQACMAYAITICTTNLKGNQAFTSISSVVFDPGVQDVHYQDLYVHSMYLYLVIYDYILILFISSYISIVYHVQLLLYFRCIFIL